MFVLLVTAAALFLVSSDYRFFDDWNVHGWDDKFHSGLVVVFPVSLFIEIISLKHLMRFNSGMRQAVKWVLLGGLLAIALGLPIVAILESPVFDSLQTLLVAPITYLIGLVGTSAFMALLWRKSAAVHSGQSIRHWPKAFFAFLSASLASAVAAMLTGWLWHRGYDWWQSL